MFVGFCFFSDYSGAVGNDLYHDPSTGSYIPTLVDTASGIQNNIFTYNQQYSDPYQTGND